MRNPRGSLWWKWDLHVHTPASLVQGYGGDTKEAWDRFFSDIEALPQEVKVIGINDYLFLEGYQRVLEARRKGRLTNIDLILPVIELRLDRFGGSKHQLSKVNFHTIFSDKVKPEVIQHQFINALRAEYRLAGGNKNATWAGIPTLNSLADLGREIINSVPEEHRANYKSPLFEGFSNLTFHLDSIRKALQSTYFQDKVVTAVGKTEWASIRWIDGSIADKKDVINSVDFVFTSADSPEDCKRSRDSLKENEVNPRLLDCSDAHYFSDSTEKNRLGKCFTWINADTEFEGLLQALKEPDYRIALEAEPNLRQRVRRNRTKYIQCLRIEKTVDATLDEPWFDQTTIELNPGLVAIIGNKGSGKSALVDIVGLLGDTARYEDASFLTATRFCDPIGNKARNFEAQLIWENSHCCRKKLDAGVDASAVETVTYIPQHLFEEICNELTGTKPGRFDHELKQVIFSHVSPADRLNCTTLDDLLAYRTEELSSAIDQRRTELLELNREIVRLEHRTIPEHRRQIENHLNIARAELASLDAARPVEVLPPPQDLDPVMQTTLTRLTECQERHQTALGEITNAQSRQAALAQEIVILDRINQRLTNFQREYDKFVVDSSHELQTVGLQLGDIVSLVVQKAPLENERRQRDSERQALVAQLDEDNTSSLIAMRDLLSGEIKDLQHALDEPNQLYQEYRVSLGQWHQKHASLVGTSDAVGSVTYYENQLKDLDEVPAILNQNYEARRSLALQIHDLLVQIAQLYRQLYQPVQHFIDNHEVARDRLKLEFDVSIVDAGFEPQFLDWINKSKAGSFSGVSESASRVREVLDRCDFNIPEKSIAFVEEMLDSLRHDRRVPGGASTRIVEQLRTGKTEEALLDFLFGFEYVKPRYLLKMAGRELHQLSPGEKGALLLVFYLLVDRDDKPLLIDQPEENLDNQTIVHLLVPSIKEAKRRRQIVIVTHNPNLAVVCDAEQVICANKSMEGTPTINYATGAIENPLINRRVVDVLEGTWPAFDNRGSKYHPERRS